ncbi:hypothetical protein GCM10023339_40610 [Alloalcanivorax gelatiniphagus]
MSNACLLASVEEIACRGLQEVEGMPVAHGLRRVDCVYHHVSAIECLIKSLSGERIDAVTRGRDDHFVVTVLMQRAYDTGPDAAGAARDNDLHVWIDRGRPSFVTAIGPHC